MNTTVTIRHSNPQQPTGQTFSQDRESGNGNGNAPAVVVNVACSTGCCLVDNEAGLGASSDDKYRKRRKQRNEKRLRNGLMALFVALCLLAYTMYTTRGEVRKARKGERRRHGREKHEDKNNAKEDSSWMNLVHHDFGKPQFDDQNNAEEKVDFGDRSKLTTMERHLIDLDDLNERMKSNTNTSIRWADMSDVPDLPGSKSSNKLTYTGGKKTRGRQGDLRKGTNRKFFQIHRPDKKKMAWEQEFDAIVDKDPNARPNYVNYVHHKYNYPEKLSEPPELGKYPRMRTYKEIMDTWPQDNLDNPPDVLEEDLMHFDWNIPADMEAAVKFREAKLPFKVRNVPEILEATKKWTDEYLAAQFDKMSGGNGPQSTGRCNEGPNNFFAFFNAPRWSIEDYGLAPTRDNDFTFERWAKHSQYADRVGLNPDLPHFYWQSGVTKEERHQDYSQWTFVSRDLTSWSSTEEAFVTFHPELQKGIQCRYGERGITAANHYDSGRNMIAMVTGAKRYMLSPPRACKRLGIVSNRNHPSFRHSMLNYGRIAMLEELTDMPITEKKWLEFTGTAEVTSTVVKEGEILYIPTGWFHYITSLQKSAQCNVRSGPDMEGDAYWGGADDINEGCFPH